MTLQQEALRVVRLLPDEKLPALIAFAQFLTQSDFYGNAASPDADTLTRRRAVAGILRGKVRMADDFNETPDIFKEYV